MYSYQCYYLFMAFVEIDCEEFTKAFKSRGFTESKRGNELVLYKRISTHIAIVVYSSCSVNRSLREYGKDAIRVTVEVVSDWDGKTPVIHPIFTSKTVKRTSILPKIIERIEERIGDALEFANNNLSAQPCKCNCAMYSSGRCFCPKCENYYKNKSKQQAKEPIQVKQERQAPVSVAAPGRITDGQRKKIFALAREKGFIVPPGLSNFSFSDASDMIQYLINL